VTFKIGRSLVGRPIFLFYMRVKKENK